MASGDGSLLERVTEGFFSEGYQDTIDAFVTKHASMFLDVTDEQLAGEDNSPEHYVVYQEFCKLMEDKLAEVIKKEGSTVPEFYRQAKELSRRGGDLTFVQIVLATAEFPNFLALMREEARDNAEEEAAAKLGGES